MRENDEIVPTTHGRFVRFCIDPIEKKPLNHFILAPASCRSGPLAATRLQVLPELPDISKTRDMDRLMDQASPEAIADAAVRHGCRSVASPTNDPVVFPEYAMDVADACHARETSKTVAVSAGARTTARRDFHLQGKVDAANVDLNPPKDDFYFKLTAHLQPVRRYAVYLEAREPMSG